MDETLRVALQAAAALDALGVRWFLGGSLASSLHGVPRATLDVDLVAELMDWFQLGHEISERQWAAIQGVLRVNKTTLDLAVLKQGARELGVDDLLTKALAEAGITP